LTPKDLVQCASGSSNTLIREEFESILTNLDGAASGPPRRASSKTVIAKFRSQLNTLMECIEKTKTRYIRCIKPNSVTTPRIMNHCETMNQLESAGLVTAITISRETFPNRLPYDDIWERFECLDQDCANANRPSSGQMQEDELNNSVESLLKYLLVKPFTRADGARVPSFACGRTRVYFRTGALEHLESDRMEYYSFYAAKIGNWYRSTIARVKFVRIKNMATALQARARKLIAQNRYKSMREALLTIQSYCRMFLARRSFVSLRKSAIKIQTMQRMVSSKRKLKSALVSVVLLQSNFRATIAMVRYSRMQTSAVMVQSYWRGSIAREATVQLMKIRVEDNECAAKIQLWYRSRINAKRVACYRPGVSDSTNRNLELEISSPLNRAEPDLIARIDSVQNAIDAGELYRLKGEVAKLKNENIELKAEVGRGSKDIKVLSERNSAVQEDQERRSDLYKAQLYSADSLRKEKLLVEEQKQNQDAALASIRDQFAKVSQEKIEKESEVADLVGIIKSLECNYDFANDNLKDSRARISSLEEEVDVRETKIEELDYISKLMKEEIHEKDSQCLTIKDRVDCLEIENGEMDVELKNSYDEINTVRGRFVDFETEAEEMNKMLEKSYGEVNTLQSRVSLLETEGEEMNSKLKSAYGEVDLLGDLVETSKRTVGTYETQCSDMTAEISNLRGNNDLLHGELDAIREDRDEEVESLREQLEIALEQNTSMRRKFEELESNKIDLVSHIQSLMTASKSATNRTQSLLDTNKTLLAELSKLKIENAKVRQNLNSATVQKEDRSHPSTAKYERMVYDRETEIIELKELLADALRGRERFAQSVDKKMRRERETLLLEIHNLKAKLRNAQEKSDDYNKKIMGALQTAHSTREAGVRKLKREVLRLTQELDKANSGSSISLSSLVHRQRFEQTKGYLEICQGARQKKLFELLTRLKTLQFQNGGSIRDNLLQKIINSLEELFRSEELESTKIMSTFDETC
jgi:myosin heavy subunit